MKPILSLSLALLILGGAFRVVAEGAANRLPPQLVSFCAAKERQERQLARELRVPLPSVVTDFFKLAQQGNFPALSNILARCEAQLYARYAGFTNGQPAWLPFWQPMTEVESAYGELAEGGSRFPLAFGEGIIRSLPPGSIYFGGTDPGRMLVTALCESHVEGKPFYTLTQNALCDERYMAYLRRMYGRRITLPTTNDVSRILEEYKEDARRRLKHDQNYPEEPRQVYQGEQLQMVTGVLKFEGPVAVMAVSSRIVKWILAHNPTPEFFMEESFPLELIYPYLAPHGLVFKMNHEPLPKLPVAAVEADQAFWSKQCGAMIGDWLKPETSASNVCEFATAVFGRKDWTQFTGDREFVTNGFAPEAFSKLRVSIAGMYQWRLDNGSDGSDKAQMRAEADLAFRQAFALCPTSPEAVFRYLGFLMAQGRTDDAILVMRTAHGLVPQNEQFNQTLSNLLKYRP